MKLQRWSRGDTVTVRNIARSDGTVTTAVPALTVEDSSRVLALYIPKNTLFKNNYVVPPGERVAAVAVSQPSAARAHRDLRWWHDTVRLYLPERRYSVWLFFAEGLFTSWYGNLEAPFVRTPTGIDTRDFALDIVATPDGTWQWKDKAEFQRRFEVGLDSAEHQARVRAAGEEFIERFERKEWPFGGEWQTWQPPDGWQLPRLPAAWHTDFGSHERLE